MDRRLDFCHTLSLASIYMDDLMNFVSYCLDTLGKVGAIEFERWVFVELGSYAVKALASCLVTIPGLKKTWDWMGVLVQSICKWAVGYPMACHKLPQPKTKDVFHDGLFVYYVSGLIDGIIEVNSQSNDEFCKSNDCLQFC
jgi:hypothetical protein